jgi:ABC-type Zn uptake system ZnuABC Zn-binding protein ZnuA
MEMVKIIPEDRRNILSDHLSLAYFNDRYGFHQAGQIISGFSTLASVSANDLARLNRIIRLQKIPAIFVDHGSNNAIANQLAEDTGIKIVELYTGSLSRESGMTGSYTDLILYDARSIVEGLK